MLPLRYIFMLSMILFINKSNADNDLIGGDMQFHGTVISRPCDIVTESQDQLVELKTISVKHLYRNLHSLAEPFSIKLINCKTAVFKDVNIMFSGVEDSELPGHFAITGEATGIGLALFDASGEMINLGSSVKSSLYEGNNQLDFSAWIKGHPKAIEERSITEGDFIAIANFTLSYL